MNLVVGATGVVGSDICRRLALAGKPVKALVRKTSAADKQESLKRLGVVLVEGDVKDRPTLEAACQGVTAVISTASATLSRQSGDSIRAVDLEGQMNLVDAAKAAGVQHFIYVSARRHQQLDFPLQRAKETVERHLRDSGLTWTILQPSFFMEIWLSPVTGFDYQNGRIVIFGTGHNRVSLVSYHDVAAYAVTALENPKARNAAIPVGGPRGVDQLYCARVFEGMVGRTFGKQYVSEDALRAQLEAATDPMEKTFAGLKLMYAMGDEFDMRPIAEEFNIRPTSVRDYARAAFGWRAQSTGVPE